MLRTINAAVRGELIKGQVQKVVRANSTARTSRTVSSSSNGASGTSRCSKYFYHINDGGQIHHRTSTGSISNVLRCEQRRLYSSGDLPPHTRVTLPALSPTMEEGTLISWEKKEGDKLSEGDLLAEIETDKATMAMETPEEGYLAKILIPAGTKGVPIGKLVCIIVENESDVAKFKDYTAGKDDAAAKVTQKDIPREDKPLPQAQRPQQQSPQQLQQQDRPSDGERVYASPMARRLAEQRDIRLLGKGTGLYGSITSKDLDNMKGAPGPVGVTPDKYAPSSRQPPKPQQQAAAYVDLPISNMRLTIAKRLLQSKQLVPHYYITSEIIMDRIVDLRKRVNVRIGNKEKFISVNDFVLKAVAAACQRVPGVNSSWMDSVIRQYSSVDISVAVSTPKGLITPIIFNAQTLGVQAISEQMKALAAKARAGKLQPHEYQGGTISVSNLGMYGVTHFAAIINPPQAAILAVGAASKRGEHQVMNVTLSADHRVIDGAVGAQWLQVFQECLEDPGNMILNDPNKPCHILTFKEVTMMLDCGLSLQSVLNFLPLTLGAGSGQQGRELPSWILPGADLVGELRENCDRVFVDAAPEFCPPLDKLVDFGQVDVILISNYLCMLALPYVTEATGFRGRVLATEPTLHIGRLLLEELVEYVAQCPEQQQGLKGQQWKNLVHRLPYPLSDAFKPKSWRHIYTLAQVNASLARVSLVGYGERVDVFGVQVTPASSGFCLGSSNWVISSVHEKLVYLSGSSTLTTHPRSIDHSSLRNADVLIMTDLTQTPVSNPDAMLGVLCVVVGLTLRGGGNVLLPCYPTGVVYDLFECLSVKMADLGVAGCPMYFISPVAEQSLAYSNILAEWLSSVKQNKVYVPDDPFPHALLLRSGKLKHFKRIYSPGFSTDFQEPCVVFCGHPSLRFGDVVQFVELWGQNPRNCIVFTEPDFDYIDALAPHQPLQMKVAHCAIDTSLNFTQANKLVRELKPGALVVPECYTQPPVASSVTNGASNGKLNSELVISVGDGTMGNTSADSKGGQSAQQTQLITYRWGEVVQLPVRRKRARLHLDNQVAQRLIPVVVDPIRPLSGTSGTISLATVTGALQVRDGVYTVTELDDNTNNPVTRSKASRYEYGTVNVAEFLQRLTREGITDAKVEQMSSANIAGANGIMIHLPEHDALIQIEDNCTHVLCNSDQRLRSRLRSILMQCLNKF